MEFESQTESKTLANMQHESDTFERCVDSIRDAERGSMYLGRLCKP